MATNRKVMEEEFDRRLFGKTVVAKVDALLQFKKAHPEVRIVNVMRFKMNQDTGKIFLQVEVESR